MNDYDRLAQLERDRADLYSALEDNRRHYWRCQSALRRTENEIAAIRWRIGVPAMPRVLDEIAPVDWDQIRRVFAGMLR